MIKNIFYYLFGLNIFLVPLISLQIEHSQSKKF